MIDRAAAFCFRFCGFRRQLYVERFGGPGRDRTGDLFHAMEARSQLRHRPTVLGDTTSSPLRTALSILAEWT